MVVLRTSLMTAALALASLGCAPTPASPSPSPTTGPPIGSLQIRGTWIACHQMGECRYSAELRASTGTSTAPLEARSDGELRLHPGIPDQLPAGNYEIELIATMYGDTIEPNGSQTVVGTDARCEAAFRVGPGRSVTIVTATFTPTLCTLDLEQQPAE